MSDLDTPNHEWHLIHNTWVACCNVCAMLGYSQFDGYRRRWLAEFRSRQRGAMGGAAARVNAIAESSGPVGRDVR